MGLYNEPANMFVAGFIGSPQMNFTDCKVTEEGGAIALNFDGNKIVLPDGIGSKLKATDCVGKDVVLGIRPEDIHDEEAFLTSSPESVIDAFVEVTEQMGSETFLYTRIGETAYTARVNPRTTAVAQSKIKVAFDLNKIHIFDKETEVTILN